MIYRIVFRKLIINGEVCQIPGRKNKKMKSGSFLKKNEGSDLTKCGKDVYLIPMPLRIIGFEAGVHKKTKKYEN